VIRYALLEGSHAYDRQKYAAMLREAFEPFEQFTATPGSLPDFARFRPRRRFVSLSSFHRFETAASRRI